MSAEQSGPNQGGGEKIILDDLDTGDVVSVLKEVPVPEKQYLQLNDSNKPSSTLSISSGTLSQYDNENDSDSFRSPPSISTPSSFQHDKENVSVGSSDTASNLSAIEPNYKKKKSLDLESYLRSTADGKYILTFFHEHKKLDARPRSLLNRLIIENFADDALKTLSVGQKLDSFSISSAAFIELSKAIASLFPGESEAVYYSPYRSENGIRVPTSGGLWEHYNYTKEVLRSKNLLTRPIRTQATHEPQNLTDEDTAELSWSEKNISLWSKVCEYWTGTFSIRRRKLTVENLSVTAYINLLPCLRLQDGKQLIQQDFEKLYPGKSSWLLSRWNSIKVVLIRELQTSNTKSIDDKALIKLLPTLTSDAQDAVILSLLPRLIDSGHPGRVKKNQGAKTEKKIKYSQQERREFFIHHVETSSDIAGSLERFKERASKVKLTLQPILIIVGNLLKIDQAFVQIDDQKYEVNSCLEALDLTFKLFFVLDCEYPKPSATLWQFIQIAGFEIHVPGDRVVKSVNILLGLLKQAFSDKL